MNQNDRIFPNQITLIYDQIETNQEENHSTATHTHHTHHNPLSYCYSSTHHSIPRVIHSTRHYLFINPFAVELSTY